MVAAAPADGVPTAPGAEHRPAAPAGAGPRSDLAPTGPPLVGANGGAAPSAAGAEVGGSGGSEVEGSGGAELDPLVGNGLTSPFCEGVLGGERLAPGERRDCHTSGFLAAPAPTEDYGLDVHIETGFLGISSNGVLSVVQDVLISPIWMALVWSVHALIVMLQWAFSIDLLDTAAAGGVGRGLRQMQSAITDPWLALALAVASVLALYDGLIRRRVAETLGDALLLVSMVVGGMWVIADPSGTVGALGGWANSASLGTLAIATAGATARPAGALGEGMDGLFATAVEGPWCYLEFGNVSWCREPAELESDLRRAGERIAGGEIEQVGCASSSCAPRGSAQAETLEHSAELLREARTNGEVFLALPANGPERNAISRPGSLLRAICRSSEATSCHGPSAAEAEFRTEIGTWPRVAGLLLIVLGASGMLLLFGFIALRLLAAALLGLLLLLLAPVAVLAPAFGEAGRSLFRRWSFGLFGAVVAKLLFAFLLGVVIAVGGVLSSFTALGWWTQWLLLSAFWWGAFTRRHQALGHLHGSARHEPSRSRPMLPRRPAPLAPVRRAADAARGTFGAGRRAHRGGHRARELLEERVLGPPAGPLAWPASRSRIQAAGWGGAVRDALQGRRGESVARLPDAQAERAVEQDEADARAAEARIPRTSGQIAAGRAQLRRVEVEQGAAVRRGDRRRALELAHRGGRIEGEIRDREADLRPPGGGDQPSRAARQERVSERSRFLDAQAALLPESRRASRSTPRRDYAQLAGLVGIGAREYHRLEPFRQRVVRLEMDRELALRRELPDRGPVRSPRRPPPVGPALSPQPESPVMRDAREVAAGRKRELGFDRE